MSLRSLLLLACCSLAAASDWTFTAGKATIARKGDPEASSLSFGPGNPFESPIPLAARDILKLTFILENTAPVDDEEATPSRRPHQAFLLVKDPISELETFFPLSVKETSGRAKVDLTHKEIPSHLLSSKALDLSLALGSFGPTGAGTLLPIGRIAPNIDSSAQAALEALRVRDLGDGSTVYVAKQEIRHTFRADPTNPAKTITVAFVAAVVVAYFGLFGVWFPILGANLGHLPRALKAAPISSPLFFASMLALEGIFFMYYTSWNLFQTLGAGAVVGVTTFLSGSRALREVRARRERGER